MQIKIMTAGQKKLPHYKGLSNDNFSIQMQQLWLFKVKENPSHYSEHGDQVHSEQRAVVSSQNLEMGASREKLLKTAIDIAGDHPLK